MNKVTVLAGIIMITAITLKASGINPSAAYIQRTMKQLENSTHENPAHVRVMFYGQSITAGKWPGIFQRTLEERYPTVEFEFHNAAIGGYGSSLLRRTAEHDLYPWYPDILFFHVYGPMDRYEEIIRRTREQTTAEIVLWTSHFGGRENPDETTGNNAEERADGIRDVARRYKCMIIDLREKWRKHLKENDFSPSELLTDNIHLNDEGNELYAKFIGEEILRIPELGDNPVSSGKIRTVTFDSPDITVLDDGKIILKFTGNRVIALSDGTGDEQARAAVLLNGMPMSGNKALWAATRPSRGPQMWMPAINNIGFDNTPIEEEWILTCLENSKPDGTEIHFTVEGSETGSDGRGVSTERFISNSGRVVIEPFDWRLPFILQWRKIELPENFQVAWKTYPLFADLYTSQPDGTKTLLVQGCENTEHTLTLVPENGAFPGIAGFTVYEPPLKLGIKDAPADTEAVNNSAAYIQRTMKQLENSTNEEPAEIRVMFYGQSITRGLWSRLFQEELEQRYPDVRFEFNNAALGGYTSPLLSLTAEHDLYPWYPDILFFHVYGRMDKYEEIVRRTRKSTTAEIVLWTSHFRANEKPDDTDTPAEERAAQIRNIAAKYNCMLIDLREKWREYLKAMELPSSELLTDSVHLTSEGHALYARFIGEEMLRIPELGDNPVSAGTVETVPIDSPDVTICPEGTVNLRFKGNRVVAVSDGTGDDHFKASVLLNGKPMDDKKELWAISRPSRGPWKDWPALNRILFERPLAEESWTLTFLPDSDIENSRIHFEVEGSVTGKDGRGWSTERFVSNSGRVVLESDRYHWRILRVFQSRNIEIPQNYTITWEAYPLFTGTYEAKPEGTKTLMVQGCENTEHTLTLVPENPGEHGISKFIVYSPPQVSLPE